MDKYQTFWRRVGAAMLDFFVLIPVNWGGVFLLSFIDAEPTILTWAVTGFISALYYILMHYYYGQTLGKMAARVKVLDDSEMPLNFGQSIVRSLPELFLPMYAVSFSTADQSSEWVVLGGSLIYGLDVLFSFINTVVCMASDKHRALHDFIAGTIVVRTDV